MPAAGTNAASNLPSKIPGGLVTKGTSNLGYEKVRVGGTGQTPFPFPPQGMFGGMGALGGMGSMGFFPGMAGMPQHSLNPAQLFRKCNIFAGFICWLEQLKFVGCTAQVTLWLACWVLSMKSFGMAFLVSLFLAWFLGNRSDVKFKHSCPPWLMFLAYKICLRHEIKETGRLLKRTICAEFVLSEVVRLNVLLDEQF